MAAPNSLDEYLAAIPESQRAVLEDLRKAVKAAAPTATDVISYKMPAVKVDGRIVVWYAAFKDHCSLYPASEAVMKAHGKELGPYLSGKGTLRFTPEKPIPARLLRKIVKTRIEENARLRGA
ncbi:MAG: iron chaperone [Actinomycetota bacterium]